MDTKTIIEKITQQIEDLVEKAKNVGEEAREELEDTIAELQKQKDKLEDKVEEFKAKNEPKFDEAKFHLRNAAEELEQAVRKLFNKGPGAEEV